MTIDKLSPEEVKGLLAPKGENEKTMSQNLLKQVEKEALSELLNVSLGGSSAVLSSLFPEGASVSIREQSIVHRGELLVAAPSPLFVVLGEYGGGIKGLQILSISKNDAGDLAESLGTDREDMEKQFLVLQEVLQKMFASVSRTMSMLLELEVSYSLSGMDIVDAQQDFPVAKFTGEEWFAETRFLLEIGGQKPLEFQLFLPIQLVKQMIVILIGETDEAYPEEKQEMEFKTNATDKRDELNEAPVIQAVQFSDFDELPAGQAEPNNLNMLLDIPLQVTVELGRTKRMVKEILNVSPGSIIELDKLAGEPVDILINNKLIAVGEVVVIDENFGVRVTDILSTADRISKLR